MTDAREVLVVWEQVVREALAPRWVERFLTSAQVARLQNYPIVQLQQAAEAVHRERGELRLDAWLARVTAPSKVSPTKAAEPRPLVAAMPRKSQPSTRGGRSHRSGEVWSAPVDGDAHRRISQILNERPQYD